MRLGRAGRPELYTLVETFLDFHTAPDPATRGDLFLIMARDQWDQDTLQEVYDLLNGDETLQQRLVNSWEVLKDAKSIGFVELLNQNVGAIGAARREPPRARPVALRAPQQQEPDPGCCLL